MQFQISPHLEKFNMASAGDTEGNVTVLTIVRSSTGPDDGRCVVQLLADAKAHVAEVSAVMLLALPLPSALSSPLALITASSLREWGGGGVIKVFAIPGSNDGGTGGLVCVRVFTGISSPPVKLLVMLFVICRERRLDL